MLNALYTIIIYPLYQIVEVVYRAFFDVCKNQGIAIIGVSVAITLLCLPLYIVAENWQIIERNTQKKLESGIKRIKETFKGDEQYMILTAFYKENKYHPMMALRSSFGLLIQIPFFMAAYAFLSNNHELLGRSFLFIKDLGSPDCLYSYKSFNLNILPIAMTLINIIAAMIYTKGFTFKQKALIYLMALLFLVILYNSPAGLVLYWTMNNVFSLVKNVFYKLKNPVKTFWIMMCAITFISSIYILQRMGLYKSAPVIFLCVITFCMPLIIKAINWLISFCLSDLLNKKNNRHFLFLISSFCLFLIAGGIIPSFLITSSTAGDYAYVDGYSSPLFFLGNTMLQAFGLFFFWPVCIYFLFEKKTQTAFSLIFFTGVILSLINSFCFLGDYGSISADLIFLEHKSFKPSLLLFILSSLTIFAVLLLALFAFKKNFLQPVKKLVSILTLALFSTLIVNIFNIQKDFSRLSKPNPQLTDIEPIMHLSKTGKNVICFMLDKSPGFMIEDSFNEDPDLYNKFTGFTFYPNTVSFGAWTIQGATAMYGGYEYTPWAMNHRREEEMVNKHNQALSLLATIYENEGYSSYVVDPPYPNYDTIPIFCFFDGHKNIHPSVTIGKYTDIWYKQNNYEKKAIKSSRIKRNLIWFSIFKISPPALRSAVHYSNWWSAPKSQNQADSDFLDRFSVLTFLKELTAIDKDENCFIFIDNESTHDAGFCQAPEFLPVDGDIDFSKVKNDYWRYNKTYHSQVASLKQIGYWLDWFKENNIYDNTRIIIVADHGYEERSPKFDGEPTDKHNIEHFNPMLMVKDFNQKGRMQTDNKFMTQCDVPALATEGIVKNPKNPFTGKDIKPLTYEEKMSHMKISFSKANAVRSTVDNGFKISDDDWFTVKENIFKSKNWRKLNVKNGELVE